LDGVIAIRTLSYLLDSFYKGHYSNTTFTMAYIKLYAGKATLLGWLFLTTTIFADNVINIEQQGTVSSDNSRIDIDQRGYDNDIDINYQGDYLYINYNQWVGGNSLIANVTGTNNQIIGQAFGGDTHTINIAGNNNLAGTWYGTSGDNNVEINLLGNNNFGAVEARGNGGHNIQLNLSNGGNVQLFIDKLTPDTFVFSQDCATITCSSTVITRQ